MEADSPGSNPMALTVTSAPPASVSGVYQDHISGEWYVEGGSVGLTVNGNEYVAVDAPTAHVTTRCPSTGPVVPIGSGSSVVESAREKPQMVKK
jgi:hypothetical protein